MYMHITSLNTHQRVRNKIHLNKYYNLFSFSQITKPIILTPTNQILTASLHDKPNYQPFDPLLFSFNSCYPTSNCHRQGRDFNESQSIIRQTKFPNSTRSFSSHQQLIIHYLQNLGHFLQFSLLLT